MTGRVFLSLPCIVTCGSNADVAMNWCENTACPSDCAQANQENCCLHHVNVHSCPEEDVRFGLCPPWVPSDGEFYTHSTVMCGSALHSNWTAEVSSYNGTLRKNVWATCREVIMVPLGVGYNSVYQLYLPIKSWGHMRPCIKKYHNIWICWKCFHQGGQFYYMNDDL